MKSASLYFKSGSSDKQYRLQLEETTGGYLVNFQFGKTGSTLRTGTKTPTPVSLAEAEKIYAKKLKEQLADGYLPNATDGGNAYSEVNTATIKDVLFVPQLLNTIEENEVQRYINDDAYIAQEKKDGERRPVIAELKGKIVGINKKGTEVALPRMVIQSINDDCTLDGEIIDETLYVFDLLSLNGLNLKVIDYQSRLANLNDMTFGNSIVVVETAYTTKEKQAMFDRLKKDNKEGIVFKKRKAVYTGGRPSSGGDQLKFKFQKTATFIVVNHTSGKRSVGLELCLENDNTKRVFMGKVTIPPNASVPSIGELVEVQYLYAYKGGAIFQPVYLGKRTDSDLTDATMKQIVYKAEE